MARLRSTGKPHAASRPQPDRDTGTRKAVQSDASSTKGSNHASTDGNGALQLEAQVKSNQMTPGEEEQKRNRCRGQRSNNHNDQPTKMSITEGEKEQLSQNLFDHRRCGDEKHRHLKSTGATRCQIDCREEDSSDTGTVIEKMLPVQCHRQSHLLQGEGDDNPELSNSSTSVENLESLMDEAWKLMRALFYESAAVQEETTVPSKLEIASDLIRGQQESGGATRSTQKRAVKRSRKRKHSATSSASESPYRLLCNQLMFFLGNGYTSVPSTWPESCRRRRPPGQQDKATAEEENPPQWLYDLLLDGVCCHASKFRLTSSKTPSLKFAHDTTTTCIDDGVDSRPGAKARGRGRSSTIGKPTPGKFCKGASGWSLESVATGVWPDIRTLHTVCRECSEWCEGRGSRFGNVQSFEGSDLASGLAFSGESSPPTSSKRQSVNPYILSTGLERELVAECGEKVREDSKRTTSSAPMSTSSKHPQYIRSSSNTETKDTRGSDAYSEVTGETDKAELDEDSTEKYDEKEHLATGGACRFPTSTRRVMAWELERFSDKVLNVVLLGYLYDQSDKTKGAKTPRAKRRTLSAAKWEYAKEVLSDFERNSEMRVQGLNQSVIEKAERRMRKLALAMGSTPSEIQRLP